jgi:predicted nucleic-acid-binding Zn-ribbon protein
MSEVKKCPKCNGEMERGKRLVSYGGVTLAKKGDFFGDKITPFYCKNCGFIELYKEMKEKKE